MDWRSFVLGLLIGWLAELAIDFLFWRKPHADNGELEQYKRDLSLAQTKINELEQEIATLKQTYLEAMAQAQAETANLQTDYGLCQKRAATLEADLAQQVNLQAETLSAKDRLQADYNACQDQVTELEAKLAQEASDLAEPMASRAMGIDLGTRETPVVAFMEPAEPIEPEDLKLIEGIGPKIAELCNMAGIYTFAQLASSSLESLQTILDEAGPRYRMANPTTWAHQAQLAADGDWDGLKALQNRLKGGSLPGSGQGEEGFQ